MDFRLENLSDGDFERLVNILCQRVLGTGVVSFSKGKDGGRDGRFTGTANEYPSKQSPWVGKFIIQAKHTDNYNASCSDNPFFGNKTSTVNSEIEKVNILKSKGEIDNYLIVTNRKESEAREDAVKHIIVETGLTNVDIIGKETIHNWLLEYDDIAKQFKLGRHFREQPLQLTDFDIKDAIIAFGKETPRIKVIQPITKYLLKNQKNKLNNLSQHYYDAQIRHRSLEYFEAIDAFLSDPKNEGYTEVYHNFAFELSNKIEIERDVFNEFEEIFSYLYDLIFIENKVDLKKDKRLIWVFLHHLYFNCHIGRIE